MKPGFAGTRILSALLLMAFVFATGFQIRKDFRPAKLNSQAQENFEIAALLPSHSPAAEASVKFLKTVSECCFFQSGLNIVVTGYLPSLNTGLFPHADLQLIRLLIACISINAP